MNLRTRWRLLRLYLQDAWDWLFGEDCEVAYDNWHLARWRERFGRDSKWPTGRKRSQMLIVPTDKPTLTVSQEFDFMAADARERARILAENDR